MQPEGYCECGCGGLAPVATKDEPRKGWIKGQAKRFIHGHNQRKPERYEVRDCGYTTSCWVWQGARNSMGYGAIREGRHTRPAHRVYYERVHGSVDAPSLDHLCRNPPCVNPDHLEPVTDAENTRRGNTAKITMNIAEDIRARIGRGEVQADIARSYGISQQLVCDIKKGRKWVAP
jgi:hypothetical protein